MARDIEPPEVSWLRAYSNYLTPRVGVGSADAWTAVALYARNLLLNWLVILPVLCLVLFGLKFIATASVAVARDQDGWWLVGVSGLIGAAALIIAQAFTTSHRPVRREPQPDTLPGDEPEASPRNIRQRTFITHDLSWSVLSAIAFTLSLCSWFGTTWIDNSGRNVVLVTLAIVGAFLFAAGWIAGWPVRRSRKDFVLWVASGLVYGALVGLGAYLFALLQPYAMRTDFKLSLPIIFGIPWVLMSQLIAEMIFVGLVSYEPDSDSDREWLGRAAGWVSAAAIGWAVTAFLSVGVGNLVHQNYFHYDLGRYITALGGVSGIATALIGMSGKTSATTDDNDQSWTTFAFNLLLSIAGPVFVAALIVGVSIALDLLMFGDTLLHALHAPSPTPPTIVLYLVVGAAVALVVEVIASKNVNINRFSLHAVYRNRLVRGYLGAARQARNPDRFTGFDASDNIRVHTLWPPQATRPRPNSRVTSRQIDLAPISGSSQARGEPDFLQNTHFVKSDGPRVTAFRALAPKLAPVSAGEMSKVPASMVSLLLESQLSAGFSEMAAGDTTVGSRPSSRALASTVRLIASQVSGRMALIVLCSTDFFGVHDNGSRAKARKEEEFSRWKASSS